MYSLLFRFGTRWGRCFRVRIGHKRLPERTNLNEKHLELLNSTDFHAALVQFRRPFDALPTIWGYLETFWGV